LLSKNLKIKIYRNIILPVVLYGCETWTLTLRKECRLRVYENRVLRNIFGPKRDEVTGEWRKLYNIQYCSGYQIEKSEVGRACSTYGGEERCRGFWWGNMRERNHLEDPDIDGRIILRWICRKWDVTAWKGLMWLRIGKGGGHL